MAKNREKNIEIGARISEVGVETAFSGSLEGVEKPRAAVQSLNLSLNRQRFLRFTIILLAVIVLAGFAHVPILREVGSFLIVEDSLQPSAAIVALGGQAPFRQIEAARLYHAGWAPLVFIVQEGPSDESEALREMGIKVVPEWELSRQVLLKQGVPASAIIVPQGKASGTREELQAVWGELAGGEGQRAKSKGHGAGSEELSTKRNAERKKRTNPISAINATNAERDNALPVILVTSKYHTRRTGLTWNYVTGGRSQGITRAAARDPFDPAHWWQQRRFVLSVVREYLGLMNYYAGFPVAP